MKNDECGLVSVVDVNGMDQERRRNMLVFWTARKYLPMGGFKDFPGKLQISRMYDDENHHLLPESRTCFLQLHLRKYEKFSEMQTQLMYVTESKISTGFDSI